MTDIPPPETPGMYADAQGAWWYWDGAGWSPAHDWGRVASATGGQHQQERSQALLMWVLFLVIGGWVAALVFYLIADQRRYLRHHAAEALNLTIVVLLPQVVGMVLMLPGYIDLITSDPGDDLTIPATFWAGAVLIGLASVAHVVLGITAAIKAHRGRWWRLPIGLHPVRGVLRKGEQPPYDVGT